ncbi:hypothetical protein Pmani_014955 [Petrolisthes manimaculis]|uniref:Cuticle protein 7 n=1 Tax=Petrolisthes manimaculis TaxID=1843537 RepID=A0AAE1PSX5_9EUCA|nr:hypothetical protein Pmani_014955 [Petrolisthes manimaculis]
MNALVVISVGLSVVSALPHYYPGLAPYYPAVAPTTYEYTVVPDAAPVPAAPAPLVYTTHVAPPVHYQSQHHSQDEFGQYSFGHASPDQAHSAVRDYTGAVRGSYTYIDADGKEVVTHYIADHNGFRVASNALPVFEGEAPVAPEVNLEGPVFDLEAPVMTLQQVAETPEVEAARLEHFRLVEEHMAAVAAALAAATAEDAEPETESPLVEEEEATVTEVAEEETATEESVLTEAPVEEEAAPVTELVTRAEEAEDTHDNGDRHKRQAVFYNILPAEPVVVEAKVANTVVSPALRDAQLLSIVHNPGHATSYRVI